MKIGICHWSLPMEGPYGIKMAAELGLQGIQIDVGSHERGYLLSLPEVQKAYLEMAEKYNVEIISIAVRELDHYGITGKDGTKEREIAYNAIMTAIEVAEMMSIPNVMIPSFEKSDINTEEDFNRLVGILKESCDKAMSENITIATENLLSADENKKLFAQVNRNNLSLYFDTQNYHLRKKYEPSKMVDELFPYISQVHVKDGNDGFMSGALLGEGDSGFYKTMRSLKDKKYEGWIVLENYYDQKPLSLRKESAIELIKKDVSTLRKEMK